MYSKAGIIFVVALCALVFTVCVSTTHKQVETSLTGKIICIDAGHGGTASTDHFRVGGAGEREEWINLRVALELRRLLEERGAKVLITRTQDKKVELADRAKLAVDNKADVFISIHHNATGDTTINFPIVFYHGNASENQASIRLGEMILHRFAQYLYDTVPPMILVSDHAIFTEGGTSVLRLTYGIPGVIGEASFFTNRKEEMKLKNRDYNKLEAQAYLHALEDFFRDSIPPIHPLYSTGKIESIKAFQKKRKIQEDALKWLMTYQTAKELLSDTIIQNDNKAFDLLLQSVVSFPNSEVALDCHKQLAKLAQQFDTAFAAQELRRIAEYYVVVESKTIPVSTVNWTKP